MIAATPPSRFFGTPADIRIRIGNGFWPAEELKAHSTGQYALHGEGPGMERSACGIYGTRRWKSASAAAPHIVAALEATRGRDLCILESGESGKRFRALCDSCEFRRVPPPGASPHRVTTARHRPRIEPIPARSRQSPWERGLPRI